MIELASVAVVLTTVAADTDAVALGRTLVDEGLAACVNVLPPMQSIYRWQGALQVEPERQLVIKTAPANLPALEARLLQLHPYDLPEFLVLGAEGSVAYIEWVRASGSDTAAPSEDA